MIEWLNWLSGIVWGPWLLVLLFGTHIFLTVRLRFIQRYMGRAIRLSFERTQEGAGEISHFGALATAIAATVGMGNIVGVAAAVGAGGPGAVLWMWLTGVFGIATKYGEAVLSVKYRVVDDQGRVRGGPMYVLERALGLKWLGMLFALFTVIASFGIGNMNQANAIAHRLNSYGVSSTVSGSVMAAIVAVVLLGGVRSIARVCEVLVPFMAAFYIVGCMVLLVMHADRLPGTIRLIVESAFTGHAALGGFAGATIKEALRFGIARGLFSNESGLGSAPIVAAAAQTKSPVRQALVSASGTFWDTVVICALTGLVVVNSGQWLNSLKAPDLTSAAFSDIGAIGPIILSVGLLTFVFSTILGWSYYGEKACEYLFGSQAIVPYRVVWVAAVMVGATADLEAVWAFSDIANGLMAVPNLVSLLLLSGVIVRETREHLWNEQSIEAKLDA